MMSRVNTGNFWRFGLPAALASAGIGLLVWRLPWTQTFTHLSYELPLALRPKQAVDEVVVVRMDVESEARLGTGRWDRWDRMLHVRLLKVLKDAGARAVAFDLVFHVETNAVNTAVTKSNLVAAARAFGPVAVAARPGLVTSPDGVPIGTTLLQPFAELADAAVWGIAEGADDTGMIREHVCDPELEIPSLAWRVAELTMSSPPAEPFAPRWVNYYGPPDHLPHVSYADALDPAFPAMATFSNKVVFVGATYDVGFTGGTGADYHFSPHTRSTGRKMVGVEICATTYLNLLRGDWLRRPGPFLESGLIVLFGLALGWGLSAIRLARAALVALALLAVVPVLGLVLTWQTLWWFPWLVVAVIQVPVALGVVVLQYTIAQEYERRVMQQAWAMAGGAGVARPEAPSVVPAFPAPVASVADAPSSLPAVGFGSSARPSGPSARVEDLVQAAGQRPVPCAGPEVPDHQLLRRIGRGAYGEVWIARDLIGSFHAVKIVYRDAFKESEPFDREFKGLSRFTPISRNHPGLVHILHVGRNDRDGYLYYVMEAADDVSRGTRIDPDTYVPRTLASDLRARPRLRMTECLDVAMRLAEALEFLHRHQLIHRDIKPSNVIFVNGIPKIADIGLVTDVASTDHDVSDLGTRYYIPPEGPGSPVADVYSLGKVIYQMGFGLEVSRFPELPTPVVIDPDESALFGLNHIIMRACEANPAARYQSAAELGAGLAALRRQLVAPVPGPP